MQIVRRIWDVLFEASVRFHRDRCFDRATVIAYFALLSFLPLAVLLVTLGALALGSEEAEKSTEMFLETILQRLPEQLMTQVRAMREQAWSTSLGYLLFALWTASKVFAKMQEALDYVLRVKTKRSFALRKAFSFALVGLLSVVLVAATILGGVLNTVDRFIDTTALAPLKDSALYHELDSFLNRYVIPWALTVLAFVLVYRVIPTRTPPWLVALVGAFVAGTLWELGKVGFTYYISHIASYTRTYGALATVVIFLLWVNLSASLLLWGAELGAVCGGVPRDRTKVGSRDT